MRMTLEIAKELVEQHNRAAGGDEFDDDHLTRIAKIRVFIDVLSKETIAMLMTDLQDNIDRLRASYPSPTL